jgi:hypothetical protein
MERAGIQLQIEDIADIEEGDLLLGLAEHGVLLGRAAAPEEIHQAAPELLRK